ERGPGADEAGTRAGAEHRTCDGRGEEVTHPVVAVGSHHEKARTSPAALLDQDSRRRVVRGDRVQSMGRCVGGEKVAGEADDGVRLYPVTVDRHDVNFLAVCQTEEGKGLQCSSGLTAAAVGDEDTLSLR